MSEYGNGGRKKEPDQLGDVLLAKAAVRIMEERNLDESDAVNWVLARVDHATADLVVRVALSTYQHFAEGSAEDDREELEALIAEELWRLIDDPDPEQR
jgi:hypothetical protein